MLYLLPNSNHRFCGRGTFGNSKATDIVVFGAKNYFLRIEVKTSKNQKNFVTSYFPKYTDETKLGPDVWVFYLPDKQNNSDGDRFFILTHKEVGDLQLIVNNGNKTEKGQSCDNIPLKILLKYAHQSENRWDLFDKLLTRI